MAPKYDTDHGQHNPSDPPSTKFADCKLVTREDESIPSMTTQDEDHTDIMNKLATMVGSDRNTVQGIINNMIGNTNDPTVVESTKNTTNKDTKQPPNQLRSSMPESTLHRISKMIIKKVVEDKKMELPQSSMKVPENNADVLSLFDTSEEMD